MTGRGDWSGILAYLELAGGRLTPLSRQVAGLARQLADSAGMAAHGLILAGGEEGGAAEAELAGLPLDQVYLYRSPLLDGFRADAQAAAFIDCAEALRPSVILAGAGDRGKDLAPLAAAHFRTGLTADCTRLEMLPGGLLLQVRPAFGGNVMAEILTPEARPQMATVRSGVVSPPVAGNGPRLIRRPLPSAAQKSALTLLERRKLPARDTLSEARLVVAVGCGVRAAADLDRLRRLAERLGGVLASTRGLVERGWMPPESQIGLSGHSVAPDLLITLGLSGSVQFLAGLGGAKKIIAVNRDPEARIFSVATICLCADMYEVIDSLESITEAR